VRSAAGDRAAGNAGGGGGSVHNGRSVPLSPKWNTDHVREGPHTGKPHTHEVQRDACDWSRFEGAFDRSLASPSERRRGDEEGPTG